MILEFPWPSKVLSPNSRPHHFVKAREVKKARMDAYYLTKANHYGELDGAKRLVVSFTFYPPDKRKRDLDNVFSAMKAARDGISDALHIDDSKWQPITLRWGETGRPGKVIVELKKGDEE